MCRGSNVLGGWIKGCEGDHVRTGLKQGLRARAPPWSLAPPSALCPNEARGPVPSLTSSPSHLQALAQPGYLWGLYI